MLVRYKIRYWDEIEHDIHNERGLTIGENLGDAVNRICDWYGKTNVSEISVYECEEVLVDEEIKDMLAEE